MKILNNNNKFLINLGAGIDQIPLIKAAKKKYKLIVVDQNNKSKGKIYADLFLNVSIESTKDILNKLKKNKIDKKNIFGVINRSSGNAVLTAAQIQKKLNLDFSNTNMIKKILSKVNFIKYCIKNNLNVPKTFFPLGKKEIKDSNLYPLIIKPAKAKFGKTGIFIINNWNELKKAKISSQKFSQDKKTVIQQYVKGNDVVVMGIIKKKRFILLAIIDEINIIKDGEIKRHSFRCPSKIINNHLQNRINKIIKKIIRIFKLDNCPLNLSFRIDANKQIYLIEINLEISGELIHEKLIKFKNSRENSFDWYIKSLTKNINNLNKKDLIKKTIFINDKTLKNRYAK